MDNNPDSRLDNLVKSNLMCSLNPILDALTKDAGLKSRVRMQVLLALERSGEMQCCIMGDRELKILAESQLALCKIEDLVVDRFQQDNGKNPTLEELSLIMEGLHKQLLNKIFRTDFQISLPSGLRQILA